MPTGTTNAGRLDVSGIGLTREDLPAVGERRLSAEEIAVWYGEAEPTPGDDAWVLDLEIGSGKGTFLVQQAEREPGVRFLGVEYALAFWRHAADRVRRHGIETVRLLHADADTLVKHQLPAGLVRQCHIYFPDPWPKARHHKRRLVQAPFLRALHTVLRDDGCVRLATDHADYFAWMEEHVAAVADVFERLPYEAPASAGEGEVAGTNFERKYRREGRSFHGMILRKREGSAEGMEGASG